MGGYRATGRSEGVSEKKFSYVVPCNIHLLVHLAKDVEDERLHVEVERLVVQEQLGEQAEVLTVQLVVQPVHLVDRQASLPVHRDRELFKGTVEDCI
jgi:hypothetical protein